MGEGLGVQSELVFLHTARAKDVKCLALYEMERYKKVIRIVNEKKEKSDKKIGKMIK